MCGDDGASAVEYGLIVFAIAATIALVMFAFGDLVVELFRDTCEEIVTEASPATTCT